MRNEKVKPDAVIFSTLIKGQLRVQRYNEALNTAFKMVDDKPDCGVRSDPYSEVFQKLKQIIN